MPYPHGRCRYKVEIDGMDAGGFSEVSGFDASIDVIEYREGDTVQPSMKVPGLKKYGTITLKQGIIDAAALQKWLDGGISGEVGRKTITVFLLDIAGDPAASWQIINAWPVKYTAPDRNPTSSEMTIETLELAHEGVTRVS